MKAYRIQYTLPVYKPPKPESYSRTPIYAGETKHSLIVWASGHYHAVKRFIDIYPSGVATIRKIGRV